MLVVAALNAEDVKSSYSSAGAGLWISGFGGEYGVDHSHLGWSSNSSYTPAIMTTDQSTCSQGYVKSGVSAGSGGNYNTFNNGDHSENTSCNYTSIFNGTSSSAPTVSGVIALMLEANPNLTWRDVKHILAITADKVDASRSHTYSGLPMHEWKENAAGYEYHNWYGFGKVDAAEAVTTASSYTANNLGSWVTTGYQSNGTINKAIDHTDYTLDTIAVTKPSGSNGKVEYVRVSVKFDHAIPKSIGIRLLSPDSTVLNIFQPMTNLGTNPSSILFDIGVSGFYGENIEGNWSIAVDDYINDSTDGNLIKWGIEVYGN
jgi:subtilisin-like proprotein convertase family protein